MEKPRSNPFAVPPAAETLPPAPRPRSDRPRPSEREHREKAFDLIERMLHAEEFQLSVARMNKQKLTDRITRLNGDAFARQRQMLAPKKELEEAHVMVRLNQRRSDQGLPPFASLNAARRELGAGMQPLFAEIRVELMQENPSLRIEGSDLPYAEAESFALEVARAPFREEITQVNEAIDQSDMDTAEELHEMNLFLHLHRDDQAFLTAIDSWGSSPAHAKEFDKETGDIIGYHAGIVHFFEYRQYYEKSGRFYTSQGTYRRKRELSMDSFVEFSSELMELVNNPDPAKNPLVEDARLFEDEDGRRRLILVTKTKRFLVAFQHVGEPMRLITMFPGDLKNFQRACAEEITPQKNKKRYNELGGGRRIVPFA